VVNSGDLNGDLVVDAGDLSLLAGYLSENIFSIVPGSDIDGDGDTDVLDLFILHQMLVGP